jgi:hypothetical protein
MMRGKKSRAEAPNTPGEKSLAPEVAAEMEAKAVEVRTAFGKGVKGHLDAGRLLAEYQDKLADRRKFQEFWKDKLRWPKTRVYRLIDAHRDFDHLPEQTLGMFDLSALYALSGDGDDKTAARAKAVKRAEAGEFVTNAVANKLLGKVSPTHPTPGTVRVSKKKLNAEAKKLALDPKTVLELLEHLGVTIIFEGTKPKKEVA